MSRIRKKKTFEATITGVSGTPKGSSHDHLITRSFFKGNVSKVTYCACCVENFKHTLLAVYLHLLQEKKKKHKTKRVSDSDDPRL